MTHHDLVRRLAILPLAALAACSSDEAATPHEEPAGLDVTWCRLQSPASVETAPGQALAATGRVRVTDVTDRTDGPDLEIGLEAKFGWGPQGTVPSPPGEDGAWTWKGASAARDWDAVVGGEPGVDEYRASTTAPDVGRYGLAFAFSGDSGRTWRLCDLGGEPGSDGSEDGYRPETAGELVVRSNDDPCIPDPCTITPLPACEGNRIVRFDAPGTCTPIGTSYECTYPRVYGTDCAQSDQVCHEGGCRTPVPVDFCQHLGPADVAYAGEPLNFDGLVRVAGITDRTRAVDPDGNLEAAFGFGWPGSIPDGPGWTWLATAGGPPGWTDEELPLDQAGADVYRAEFTGAPPGEYDTAWRFSADGGATWRYCDLDGADGSLGSYNPENAGTLIVPED